MTSEQATARALARLRRGWIVATAVLLAAFATPATATELSGREVILRMQAARAQGNEDASSVVRVELRTRDGDAVTRTIATYRRQCGDEARSLIVFREPADVSGTVLLTAAHPDRRPDMWLYLPELGRVRQLNAWAQSERFMGSDLTYEDLGAIAVDRREDRLVAEGELDGAPVYKVDSVPAEGESYGRVVSWVSRANFLPVRIDYYDRAGARVKTARFGDVRTIKGVATPFAIEMEDAETGHRTRLTLLEADYFGGLTCDLFREHRLAGRH